MNFKTMTAGHHRSAALACHLPASAQDVPPRPNDDVLKIGLIYTLSGPAAALGEQARDGFMLAAEQIGQLGGMETEIIVSTTSSAPTWPRTRRASSCSARRGRLRRRADLLQHPRRDPQAGDRDGHDPDLDRMPARRTSPAPSATRTSSSPPTRTTRTTRSWAPMPRARAITNVFLMAPNYQAGKDSLAGFKHSYTGGIAGEVFTELGQLDFSLRAGADRGVPARRALHLHAGRHGREPRQAVPPGGPDHDPVPVGLHRRRDHAAGHAGRRGRPARRRELGARPGQRGEQGLRRRPTSRQYDAVPGTYAMQAYDAAQLIDSARSRAVGGDLTDRDALRPRCKKADFDSPRGDFCFGNNNYPDPGLLSGQGGQARGRQVPDRDRREDLRRLRRHLRRSVRDGHPVGTPRAGEPRHDATSSSSQLLNGLQLGVLLFLIAAGLTLVFGIMDVVNLAHGVLYMVGRLSRRDLRRPHRQLLVAGCC